MSLMYDESSRHHFARLPHSEQADAVRSLARDGHSDHQIARLSGLHVEQVRRVLARVDDGAAAVRARV